MLKILPFVSFFLFAAVDAQNFEFSGSANLQGTISSDAELPFWFHSNKRGRIDAATDIAGWTNTFGRYNFRSGAFVEVGAGIRFHNGYTENVQPDEFYLSFQHDWFSATVGRKQRQELYQGLSATNENMLWSLNSRPLPGVLFSTTRPVMLWKAGGIGFMASLEEYLMDDERYVENARVHHKSFHLVLSTFDNLELSFGIRHFAQWAGNSPDFGKLPGGINDYFKVIRGRGIGANSDEGITAEEINGLGNHLGSYEVQLKTSYRNYDIELLWNHIFEDGSGSRLVNTPDGRYGIYIADTEEEKLINALMYEFYFTKDQSQGSLTPDGTDNYFNNNLYRSGWTYQSKVLGVPFVTLNDNRFRIGNNRFIVHHFGLTGTISETVPYKLLTSYRKNYGGKGNGYAETQNVLSSYLEILVYRSFVDYNIQIGSDYSSDASPNYGFGIRLSKNFF